MLPALLWGRPNAGAGSALIWCPGRFNAELGNIKSTGRKYDFNTQLRNRDNHTFGSFESLRESMEPPSKRQRLCATVESGDDLQERRVRNDLQLKSRFETIFEKYSKDFEGIGDEIDMRTGEIVVNNGHILGMTSERDIGDFEDDETSSGELESGYYSEDEDSHSLDDYNGRRNTILKPVDLEDAGVISQAGLTWDSDNEGDSLMGEIEVERQADEQIIESWGIAVSDLEEDELANSEFEWMNPRHIRAVARDRWQIRKQQLESLDETSVDPAWRAPPLPISTPSQSVKKKASPTRVGDNRGESASEARKISTWAPEEIRGQRRKSSCQSITKEQREHQRQSPYDSNNAGQSSQPHLWALDEEDRLGNLDSIETMESKDMEPYFQQKTEQSIALNCSYVVPHQRAETTAKLIPSTEPILQYPLPSDSSFRARDNASKQSLLPESSIPHIDAKLAGQIPRDLMPVMMEQSTITDARITRSIQSSDEHRTHSCESLQRARVITNSTSLQLMSAGTQSRFASADQQNQGHVRSLDHFSQGDCKYESASDNPANTSIPRVMSVARNHKFDEEIARLQLETAKEDMHVEELPQQIDRALTVPTTAVNVCQDSLAKLGQRKYGAGHPRQVGSRELQLTEDVPAILEGKSAQTLMAQDFDVLSVPNDDGGEHQRRPIDDDATLSTMFLETSGATQAPQVAASACPVSRSPMNGPGLIPRVDWIRSTECLGREEAPTAELGTCDAISEQKLQRTSRSWAKTCTVQVVIPVVTTNTPKDTMPTVDVELDKPRTSSKEDRGRLTTSLLGEMSRHLLCQRTSSGVIESKHQLTVPNLHVDPSTEHEAHSTGAQSDLEDPLCTEIPDSQPWSRSSLSLESLGKQGMKATKKNATSLQRPQHSNKSVHNSLVSPKKQRKKPIQIAVADSFSSISEAMLDCSEDELSFM